MLEDADLNTTCSEKNNEVPYWCQRANERLGLDQRSCSTLSPVSSGMGDCLRAG